MQYRKFGKLDWQASILGFGAMRLPQTDNKPGNVNEPESILMIRYAIEHGVNYVDTAYPYHEGKSEVVVGKALKDGYRQKVKVATKLPSWRVQSAQDFDRFLDEQLKRLDIDKIDFYLLHGLNHQQWPKLRDLNIIKSAESAIKDGRIGHLGFSFHDEFLAFKEIIDGYDGWTLCQMQYNFMDETIQAGTKGLEYAAGKGLAVVVMEPLRGGRLTKNPPESVTRLWVNAPKKRTPAEWGLLWVWNHPEVSVVLSGMSRLEHVVENVEVANQARPNMLSPKELALFNNVREAYNKLIPIPCTGCGYCMPCPNGVQIPVILELYNDSMVYGDPTNAQFRYFSPVGLKETERADKCAECSNCVTACPQGIQVPEWLKKAHTLLAKPK
jgi:predicted aldo/keto reductase-like oxidoreductase